ncbi:MAG: RDD family protein [Bryobacteraceae bacterium]
MRSRIEAVTTPAAPAQPDRMVQASLFGPQAVSRVLDMPVPKAVKRSPARGLKRTDSGVEQQSLFQPEQAPASRASADAVIQCTAPVAPLVLRAMASLVDSALVLCGIGLILTVVSFMGVEVNFQDRTSTILFAISAGLIALLYKILFVLANGDTVGVRALRMRVVDFDGRPPTLRQRLYRFAGEILGVLAAALGWLWAFVDEENLTWHDHVSKTFPTASPVRR